MSKTKSAGSKPARQTFKYKMDEARATKEEAKVAAKETGKKAAREAAEDNHFESIRRKAKVPAATPATPGKLKAPKTDMIRVRIDPVLKANAEAILGELGLTPSDTIRILYKRVLMERGLPFDVKVPNAETAQAMRDADAGKGTRYASVEEMFKKQGI